MVLSENAVATFPQARWRRSLDANPEWLGVSRRGIRFPGETSNSGAHRRLLEANGEGREMDPGGCSLRGGDVGVGGLVLLLSNSQ